MSRTAPKRHTHDAGDIVSGVLVGRVLADGSVNLAKLGGDITAAGKALLDDANAATQRTTLGLGTAAIEDATDFAATIHGHASTDITDFSEAVDDRVAGLLTAGTNVTLTYNDVANTLTIAAAGGGGLTGTAIVTVPGAGKFEHQETVAAVGVTASSKVMLSLGTMADTDENAADMLDIASMGATPGTGTITILMAFTTPTSGPIPINWSAS